MLGKTEKGILILCFYSPALLGAGDIKQYLGKSKGD